MAPRPGYSGGQLEEGRVRLLSYASFNRRDGQEDDDDLIPLIGGWDDDDDRPLEGGPQATSTYYVQSRARRRLRHLILTGAALALILVVLLLALSLVAIKGGKPKRDCSLRDTKPTELGPPRFLPSSSESNRAIAAVAALKGYIRVYDPKIVHMYEGGFLPLDIKLMKYSPHYNSLSLQDECSGITLNVKWLRTNTTGMSDSREEPIVHVSKLTWFFNARTKYDKPGWQSLVHCSINEPAFERSFPARNARYSCLNSQTFQCQKFDHERRLRPVAELIIESLELQLDGDAETIRRGQFSKPPYSDSCVM